MVLLYVFSADLLFITILSVLFILFIPSFRVISAHIYTGDSNNSCDQANPFFLQCSAIIGPPLYISVNGIRNTWTVRVNAFSMSPCLHRSLWQAPFVILYPRIKHRHWTPRPTSLSPSPLLCCFCLGGSVSPSV